MHIEIIEFIQNLFQKERIPLHEPVIGPLEKMKVLEALDTGYVSSVGPMIKEFEEQFSDYTGAKYAIATSSGTAALHVSLLVAGIQAGHEVITQSLTFVATGNAIAYTGAHPVFIDVDTDTLGLSPDALSTFLEKNAELQGGVCVNKKTERIIHAVMPMHTFGHPCKIHEIAKICKAWNLKLVEDAAESLGSWLDRKHLGTHGDIAAFSFNGNKIITTGSGGMIITDNPLLAANARHLANTAKKPHAWEYQHDEVGYNYRMANLNAALGIAQLKQINYFLEQKELLARKYQSFFKNRAEYFIPAPKGSTPNYWLNSILFPSAKERNNFLKTAHEAHVYVRPVWNPLHTLPIFKNELRGCLTNTQILSEKLLNLPSSVIGI